MLGDSVRTSPNKKMSKEKSLLKFTPARLSKGKVWFVEYYVWHPVTEKLTRKRIKINRIESAKEKLRYGKALVDEINQKLYSGWNPFLEASAPRGFVKLKDAAATFLRSKERELAHDSIRSYRSYIKKLNEWLVIRDQTEVYCAAFNKQLALGLLDAVDSNDVSNTTFNNTVNFYRLFFEWLKEREYCSENPFANIRKRKNEEKSRIIIDSKTREEIKEYLEPRDYNFLIVNMLVFHAFLRPKEISQLKPSDFHLKERAIMVRSDQSKNKKSETITISNTLMEYLSKWDFNNARSHEYIFGKDFIPGNQPINPRRFSKKWDRLRKALELPKQMQLYSLKDSGIVQMLSDGIAPDEVMRQARHHDLSMTSVYVRLANPSVSDAIIKKNSSF